MKTLNRQTASMDPSRNQVEALSQTVRTLWSATPSGGSQQRETLVVQLIRLDSDIERLRIRDAIGELCPEDIGELSNCAERLVQLERRWRSDPLSSNCRPRSSP